MRCYHRDSWTSAKLHVIEVVDGVQKHQKPILFDPG